MIPILFSENSTSFTTNGIGRLADAISCIVTEERNGQYELELEVPETGAHASEIVMNSIICVIPSDGASLQPFRVYKITKPINGRFTVYAQHISYQLSHIPTMPFSVVASNSACASALSGLKNNAAESCPFTFWTDVTTVSSYTQIAPASIRSRLGGVEGSILDQFGGEYEWDGYTVKLHANRGVQNPTVTLRYGKNITDLNQEEEIANTFTGIVPFWASTEGDVIVTLPEKSVDSQYASRYPFKRTIVLDLSSNWQEAPTVSQLRTAAQAYVNKSGVGIPDVSIKVSFIHLADTEEYKDIAPLEHVKLCDIIGMDFEKYGISTTAKVVKTVYNVLADRYDSIEIGSVRSTLATTISDTNGAIQGLANTTKVNFGKMTTDLQERIDSATAWLTSGDGYVVAVKNTDGSWKELLIMDTDDVDTAHNVWRYNVNGMGVSHNGINGPYDSAWTIDGAFNANYILTGIIRGATGDNYWNMDTGEFRLAGSSILESGGTPITDYTQAYKPTTSNYPASSWTTDTAKASHVGDTFYDSANKKLYRYGKIDGVKVKFNASCVTENNYDYVYLYYIKNGTTYRTSSKLTGGHNGTTNNIANKEIFIPSDQFYLYWYTDGSVNNWGYKIDSITPSEGTATGFTTDTLPSISWSSITVGTDALPESAHPYGNNEVYGASINTNVTLGYGWVEIDTVESYVLGKVEELDADLDQTGVFNRLTNNGSIQGIYMQNGNLYVNASYIATGILADTNQNTVFNLNTGELTMKSGSINLGNGQFVVTSAGALTANNATIKGEIQSIGSNSWVDINNGTVFGGRGTTIGQNQTYISFDHLVSNAGNNINIYGDYLVLSTGGVLVKRSKNDYDGYTGYSGNYIVGLTTDYITYATSVKKVNVNWETYSNMIWNTQLTRLSDYSSNVYALTSYTRGDIDIPSSIGVTLNTISQDVVVNGTQREAIHGIVT